MTTDALATRIRSEFNESPGMCLTLRQAARLWGIAPEECARIVDRLVADDFLRWTRNGELVRSESGGYRPLPAPKPDADDDAGVAGPAVQ
jgi:hypothetical protein